MGVFGEVKNAKRDVEADGSAFAGVVDDGEASFGTAGLFCNLVGSRSGEWFLECSGDAIIIRS